VRCSGKKRTGRRYNLADGSWHDFPVLVLIVIAALVILAVVVSVAMGRGGGLSAERSDYLPLDLGPVSATDVALLRPPTGLWGYNMQATDEAMEQIAESIRERDVRIVALEQLVTDLNRDHAPMPLLASPYAGARHRRSPADSVEAEAEALPAARDTAQPESVKPPFGDPGPESVGLPADAPAAESVRLPFEPPRPSGDVSGPPERSHD
jgi:hypothetical protein